MKAFGKGSMAEALKVYDIVYSDTVTQMNQSSQNKNFCSTFASMI